MSPSDQIVTRVRYAPRGAAQEIFAMRDDEVILDGPAGTGKSRSLLEKVHLALCKYPGARGLMVRKTRTSLTSTGMVTFEEKVLHPLDGVFFHGGDQEYKYPNGSSLAVGGMDKPTKIMSSERDIVYVQEAVELTENDWESITTRLRNGVMPYQQILGDVNPDGPRHWIKRRADRGGLRLIQSRHEDNPVLWDAGRGEWTERGAAYIKKLDALTGVRYLRLRKGQWAAAEGIIYEGWDTSVHLVDQFDIPLDWPRVWCVDFGYTNPFVWQAWAIDPDGRIFRYREIYRTRRIVQDHAAQILKLTMNEPAPVAIVCDHDAEDRATFERWTGLTTVAAHKAVSPGIQAVANRLKVAGDGRPRLFLLRDALADIDEELKDAGKPYATEQEFDSYVWDESSKRVKGEEPKKENDHGMDALRYLVAAVDGIAVDPSVISETYVSDDDFQEISRY